MGGRGGGGGGGGIEVSGEEWDLVMVSDLVSEWPA